MCGLILDPFGFVSFVFGNCLLLCVLGFDVELF